MPSNGEQHSMVNGNGIANGNGPLGILHGRTRIVILGAAGRDYHTFNTLFRANPAVEVVAFTHAQIPEIATHLYPPVLSGPLYPNGIPIFLEKDLEEVVQRHKADACLMAYSDLAYEDVMKLSARVRTTGAAFLLLGADNNSMLRSSKPVIAVAAVRTGCGKSQVSRYVIDTLNRLKKKVVLVRHPMPYGELEKQVVQRYAEMEDMDKHKTTVEEREEYEQHLKKGTIVYAGVDYEAILRQAEGEGDIVLWDGGNNDLPFFKPDLWICVADPFRPGHEETYFPGDLNFRMADIIVINKADSADKEGLQHVQDAAKRLNPKAKVILTASEVEVDDPEAIKGKRVVCVDDGPTITHGGMATGAAYAAAKKYGAADIVDPRPHFKGAIEEALQKYPKIGPVVPALGYSEDKLKDLEETIKAVDCEAIVVGTPTSIDKLIKLHKPEAIVTYNAADMDKHDTLSAAIEQFVKQRQ